MPRKPASPRRPCVRFTRWRRAHFFRVLEQTGHVQMAAEAAGVSLGCIYRLRRVEAGFAQNLVAAVEEADRRLGAQEAGQSPVTVPSDRPQPKPTAMRPAEAGRPAETKVHGFGARLNELRELRMARSVGQGGRAR